MTDKLSPDHKFLDMLGLDTNGHAPETVDFRVPANEKYDTASQDKHVGNYIKDAGIKHGPQTTSFDATKPEAPVELKLPPKPELPPEAPPKLGNGGGGFPPIDEHGPRREWGGGGKFVFGALAVVALCAVVYGVASYVDKEKQREAAKKRQQIRAQEAAQNSDGAMPTPLAAGMSR